MITCRDWIINTVYIFNKIQNWRNIEFVLCYKPRIMEKQKHERSGPSRKHRASNCDYKLPFDKKLISVVKETKKIWNRGSKKHLKFSLWENVGKLLNTNNRYCMQRWKVIRERYVREKHKVRRGHVSQWELFQDLQFLDSVISYRKKNKLSECDDSFANSFSVEEETEIEISEKINEFSDKNSPGKSIINEETKIEIVDNPLDISQCNFQINVKSDEKPNDNIIVKEDSIIEISNIPLNTDGDTECETIKALVDEEKPPEKLFGEMVGAMLLQKQEEERKAAMIGILNILYK